MSQSCHATASAACRNAALSRWRFPGKRRTGSLRSHTTPRALSGICSCDTTTVGTAGTGTSSPRARLRSAATAAPALANHACTRSANTPGKKSSSMGMPDPSAGADDVAWGAGPGAGVDRGSGLRAFVRRRFPVGYEGCGVRRSPGMGSTANVPPVSGARLRSDANDAGALRASSMSARIAGESAGPSVTRAAPARCRCCPLASAPASASFRAGGYRLPQPLRAPGLARLVRVPPPCGPPRHVSTPRAAARRRGVPSPPTWPLTVVYFRASAPSAHCAKVTVSPPAAASDARIGGYNHSRACSANRSHHATPAGSPQSARFSAIHDAPAPCAAWTSAAVKSASALCLRMYCTHLRGVGCTSPG
eukprot:2919505-Pleurochrysis_carterae.AAC.1